MSSHVWSWRKTRGKRKEPTSSWPASRQATVKKTIFGLDPDGNDGVSFIAKCCQLIQDRRNNYLTYSPQISFSRRPGFLRTRVNRSQAANADRRQSKL